MQLPESSFWLLRSIFIARISRALVSLLCKLKPCVLCPPPPHATSLCPPLPRPHSPPLHPDCTFLSGTSHTHNSAMCRVCQVDRGQDGTTHLKSAWVRHSFLVSFPLYSRKNKVKKEGGQRTFSASKRNQVVVGSLTVKGHDRIFVIFTCKPKSLA